MSSCFYTSSALAYNSSSYLISKLAINLFDFEEAYKHYTNIENDKNESYLHNKLLTYINLNLMSEGSKIASQILKIDKHNQEAWIVQLAEAKLKNNFSLFEIYKKNELNKSMSLVDYIFFNNNSTQKNKKEIALSIFEIVQASINEQNEMLNYSFLLFYLSISTLLDNSFDEAYYFSAQLYQKLDYLSQAEYLYNKVRPEHKLYIDSQRNLALNKSKNGNFDLAEKILLDLNANKKSSQTLLALADFYRIEKKYNKAIIYYSDVIDSNDPLMLKWKLLYLRGICFEKLSSWDLAEKDFLHSLKINSNSPDVLNYLAYGWLEQNRNLDEAQKMLEKAFQESPKSFYILDSLGWAYYKKNQLDKALELMEEVIILAPGEIISLDHLGDIYFAMNRKREAIFFWNQALDLSEADNKMIDLLKKKIKENESG